MRVDARHRRPAAVPRDLARASPALFAQKVLTHHKHHRKSTPPLRKRPLAQKALRALRPLARPCGLDQIRPPSKNASVFRGARTSPTRRRYLQARAGYSIASLCFFKIKVLHRPRPQTSLFKSTRKKLCSCRAPAFPGRRRGIDFKHLTFIRLYRIIIKAIIRG